MGSKLPNSHHQLPIVSIGERQIPCTTQRGKAIAKALGVTEDALTNPEETASLEAVVREAFLGEGAAA